MTGRGASRKLAPVQLVTCSLSALLEWSPSGESKSSQAGLPPCFPLPSTINFVSKLWEATQSVAIVDECPFQVVTARIRGPVRNLVPRNPANHLIGLDLFLKRMSDAITPRESVPLVSCEEGGTVLQDVVGLDWTPSANAIAPLGIVGTILLREKTEPFGHHVAAMPTVVWQAKTDNWQPVRCMD
ncbi:hypothetical protein BDP55DRAFT_625464 [Colletotrichum godetiae]|uniref:Uncharacterized protein n=1 Tax=Colletotrichum godetiae TaxID=1209918 RepID=A0AAJ0EZF9_9PEZI|nr:uncharacterized protein BDP55DRAFT_625464 [Colletotrichum godetiae]KAK1701219.1 hypothetical protein BDP55DRAFT_625464 [Colletotrichum godetiae]